MVEPLIKRVAIIDLGTNTFNLLIAENKKIGHKVIFKSKIPVNLGQGGIQQNKLTKEAIERGISALKAHKNTTTAYKTDSIHAFATSAIRSASNGGVLVDLAYQMTGIKINVITGDHEADLIYKGVSNALSFHDKNSLIIDIGGGSTEFIIANKYGPIWRHSFDIGVARLLASHSFSNPITNTETAKLKTTLKSNLLILFSAIEMHPVFELIGSSGSFESIAEIIALKSPQKNEESETNEVAFNLKELNETLTQIIKSTKQERINLKGLVSFRVDTIVFASIIISFIMEEVKAENVRLSKYALREGVLGLIFDNQKDK